MENRKSQADLRLILGIFVIMFGALGIGALGIGIILGKNLIAWFGGVLTAAVSIVASAIQQFIK